MRIFNILKKFVGYVEACVLTHAVFYFIGLGSTDVHRRNVPMTPEMIVACFKTKECGSYPYQDRCQPRFLKTRVRKEVSWKAEKRANSCNI